MSAATAAVISSSYGLGVLLGGPVYAARGEQGLIWRLDTQSGPWAVKELLLPLGEAEAARDVEFQLAARMISTCVLLVISTFWFRPCLPAGRFYQVINAVLFWF